MLKIKSGSHCFSPQTPLALRLMTHKEVTCARNNNNIPARKYVYEVGR